MTLHNESPLYAEYQQLMIDLFDGRLGDEQYTRLMQLLHENPQYREDYAEQMVLHSLLLLNHRDPLPAEPGPSDPPAIAPLLNTSGEWPNMLVDEGNDVAQPPPTQGFLGFLTRSFEFGGRILANPAYFSVFILFLMISPLTLFFFLDHQADQLQVASPPMIAKLNQQSADAQWAALVGTISPGMKFSQGQILVLEKGLAEIEFETGATVLLQGPITYRLDGTNASFLQSGTMTAQVPKSASGFSVATPNTKVVDLGTEFGVTVDAKKDTEVHVFVGKVELSARAEESPTEQPQKKYLLDAGQAVKVCMTDTGNTTQSKLFAATPKKFIRCMAIKPSLKPRVVYSHYGNTDPLKEGWMVRAISLEDGNRGWDSKLLPTETAPVNKNGIAAWMIQSHVDNREIQYAIMGNNDAAHEIAKKGREQGWVIRARVMVEDAGPDTGSSAYCIYVDQGRSWPLFMSLGSKGLYTDIHGKSSLGTKFHLPVANAEHRYVDYEVRYNPKTKNADVLIDGKCVATAFSNEEKMMEDGFYFGLQKRKSKAKFALIKWEVLEKL